MASKLILSPEQQRKVEQEEESKQKYRVFDYYFSDRIDELIEMVNQRKGSFEERLKAMKVLNYLSAYYMTQESHPQLKEV